MAVLELAYLPPSRPPSAPPSPLLCWKNGRAQQHVQRVTKCRRTEQNVSNDGICHLLVCCETIVWPTLRWRCSRERNMAAIKWNSKGRSGIVTVVVVWMGQRVDAKEKQGDGWMLDQLYGVERDEGIGETLHTLYPTSEYNQDTFVFFIMDTV